MLDARQQEIKEEFIAVRGTWSDVWEGILRLDPDFLKAYLDLSAVPWRKNRLEDKVKEFIYIAVDSAATHLYVPGIRQHVAAALRFGATPAEIMEVIELTSTLGIHAMNIGVPILADVLSRRGLRAGPAPLDARRADLRERFEATRGYWHPFWDDLLDLDPEMFEAYTEFSSVPWRTGPLEPKVKEFVYIAFDCAATHLYESGLRLHIENALDHGATVDEILEVMEIASVIGIHAATVAVPILEDEVRRAGSDAGLPPAAP